MNTNVLISAVLPNSFLCVFHSIIIFVLGWGEGISMLAPAMYIIYCFPDKIGKAPIKYPVHLSPYLSTHIIYLLVYTCTHMIENSKFCLLGILGEKQPIRSFKYIFTLGNNNTTIEFSPEFQYNYKLILMYTCRHTMKKFKNIIFLSNLR